MLGLLAPQLPSSGEIVPRCQTLIFALRYLAIHSFVFGVIRLSKIYQYGACISTDVAVLSTIWQCLYCKHGRCDANRAAWGKVVQGQNVQAPLMGLFVMLGSCLGVLALAARLKRKKAGKN